MMDVYTLLYNMINPICECYVGHYPTMQLDDNGNQVPKVYPFAEINFPNISTNNSFSDNNLLEVDIWNNLDTDIRIIESLTDQIHLVLNRFHYIDADMQVSINRETPYRLALPDEVIGIQRRKLRYKLTIYKI